MFPRKQSQKSTHHFILPHASIPAVMNTVQMNIVMKAAEEYRMLSVEQRRVMMVRKTMQLIVLLLSDNNPLN